MADKRQGYYQQCLSLQINQSELSINFFEQKRHFWFGRQWKVNKTFHDNTVVNKHKTQQNTVHTFTESQHPIHKTFHNYTVTENGQQNKGQQL